MARVAREKSNSGIYHIMIRGINKQLILEDDEDNQKFLEVLKECKILSLF
jgi:putative transposase